MFIAIGYRQMNKIRENFCQQAKDKGYHLLSYISSKATYWGRDNPESGNLIGENVFILEDNTVQPFVEIGDGVILWSGNHIGHHSKIGRYCFISSHVVISGHCNIGDYCFIGVNAALRNGISIGQKNLIGPQAYMGNDTGTDEVYLLRGPEKHRHKSEKFFFIMEPNTFEKIRKRYEDSFNKYGAQSKRAG